MASPRHDIRNLYQGNENDVDPTHPTQHRYVFLKVTIFGDFPLIFDKPWAEFSALVLEDFFAIAY